MNKKAVIKNTIQFIKFGMVGVSNTLICYVVYACLVKWGLHYILANAVGFVVSVLNAFYWNNRYVFSNEKKQKNVWWKTLLKSFAAYAVNSLVLVSILLYVWIDVCGISPYISQLINLCITVPLNFIMNKFWAFK